MLLVRAVLVIALLIGGYYLVRRLRNSAWWAHWRSRLPILLTGLAILALLLVLTVRGGGEFALPLLMVFMPLFVRWLLHSQSFPASSPSAAQTGAPGRRGRGQSAIRTRFLQMTLDHATGVMSGQVLEGHFAGHALSELTLEQLLELWRLCRTDPQSVAVLEAYLDRHGDPNWRERLAQSECAEQSSMGAAPDLGHINREQAYAILGLPVGASRAEIQAAYRRLIQRLHPDQGGSEYLAACLNQARDLLLGDVR